MRYSGISAADDGEAHVLSGRRPRRRVHHQARRSEAPGGRAPAAAYVSAARLAERRGRQDHRPAAHGAGGPRRNPHRAPVPQKRRVLEDHAVADPQRQEIGPVAHVVGADPLLEARLPPGLLGSALVVVEDRELAQHAGVPPACPGRILVDPIPTHRRGQPTDVTQARRSVRLGCAVDVVGADRVRGPTVAVVDEHRSADDAGARVTGERLGNPGKVMGRQIEVAVQLDDEVGECPEPLEPQIEGAHDRPTARAVVPGPGVDCLDPVVPRGELLREFTAAVGRAIVDDHPAPRWQLLVGERAGQPWQMACLVAHGSDHRVVHARPTVPARPDVTLRRSHDSRSRPTTHGHDHRTHAAATRPLERRRPAPPCAPQPIPGRGGPPIPDVATDPADGGRRDRVRVDARADVDLRGPPERG